jgi:GT2 family glycosyltransferase
MILDDVGVVAIGRNEGERLIRCLESVTASAGAIVYVDSGSTDDSVEAARKIGAWVAKLDLSEAFTAARARNEGFRLLTSLRPEIRFVQFIDGDCELAPGWLEKARGFIAQRDDVAIVCGRRRERDPDGSIYNRLCDLEWDTPIGEALACGGDALARVEAFDRVGGFRPQLIAGEEPELCVRLREKGWKIWRLDAEMTKHDASIKRFGQWWVRAVRAGHAFAEVSWLHRDSPSRIWGRETIRSLFWGGVLPAAICIGALINPVALFGALLYLLQIGRIALKSGPTSSLSWSSAFFLTFSKFAEFQGLVRFWCRAEHRPVALMEYK